VKKNDWALLVLDDGLVLHHIAGADFAGLPQANAPSGCGDDRQPQPNDVDEVTELAPIFVFVHPGGVRHHHQVGPTRFLGASPQEALTANGGWVVE